MKKMWSAALVVVAVSAAASAQTGKEMSGKKMAGNMNRTYTGCVEAVNDGGSFLLTQVGGGHQPMMHHDDTMMADAGMAKKEAPAAGAGMHGDRMTPDAVVLTGRPDLKKHVGQKVTVTGALSHGMSAAMPGDHDTLSVASLKVIAKSCW
jgi:hypothetical protein